MSSALTIDSNVWYSLFNFAADSYLAFEYADGSSSDTYSIELASPATYWQFADYGIFDETLAGIYLVRPQNYASWCLTLSDEVDGATLSPCDESSTLWVVGQNEGAEGGNVLSAQTGAILYFVEGTASTLSTAYGVSNIDDELWTFESGDSIDDEQWSTLPYTTSATTDYSTTTTADDSTITTTDDSTTTTADVSTITTADDSTTTSTNDGGVTTTTDVPPVTVIPTIPTGNDFAFSEVNKNMHDINAIAALAVPQHMNIICTNCTVSGTLGVIAGGYDADSTDEAAAISSFFDDGYIEISSGGIAANMSLDIELLPGFNFVNTFFSLYNKTLASIKITDDLEIDLVFEIGFPLTLTLDTQVSIFAGFDVEIPSGATIFMNVGDAASSNTTGFDGTTLNALPFSVSAPDIALTATTGLEFHIYASANTSLADAEVVGLIELAVDVPRLNLTMQVLSDVDQNCNPPSSGAMTYQHAVDLTFAPDVNIHADGSIQAEVGPVSKTWHSPELGTYLVLALPSECLTGDSLKAKQSLGILQISTPRAETGLFCGLVLAIVMLL